MASMPNEASNAVELFPGRHPTSRITDELSRILELVREISPRGFAISFDFDGLLHIHVDVRTGEEVAAVEALLPTLDGGRFHSLSRRATPHHPFFHRVSAIVAS